MNQSPIKVRLPSKLKHQIKIKAEKMGLTMAGYLRFLAMKDMAEEEKVPQLLVIHNLDEVTKQINRIRLSRALGQPRRY